MELALDEGGRGFAVAPPLPETVGDAFDWASVVWRFLHQRVQLQNSLWAQAVTFSTHFSGTGAPEVAMECLLAAGGLTPLPMPLSVESRSAGEKQPKLQPSIRSAGRVASPTTKRAGVVSRAW